MECEMQALRSKPEEPGVAWAGRGRSGFSSVRRIRTRIGGSLWELWPILASAHGGAGIQKTRSSAVSLNFVVLPRIATVHVALSNISRARPRTSSPLTLSIPSRISFSVKGRWK